MELRTVPVTDSDVLSWNTVDDLCLSHSQDDVQVVPDFIEGDSACLIFSKRGSYARVGEKRIKTFELIDDVWEAAEYDATLSSASIFGQSAKELVSCLGWWEDIY